MNDHSYYGLAIYIWLAAALLAAAVGSRLICGFCLGCLVVEVYFLFRARP